MAGSSNCGSAADTSPHRGGSTQNRENNPMQSKNGAQKRYDDASSAYSHPALEIRRVRADPHQDRRQQSDHAALPAKAVALPDIPSRSESRLISSGVEISAGNTVA